MENSHIQWTDHTFNPWQGCTKVSPGCTHCYAEARDLRFHEGKHWGKGAPRLLKKDWSDPVRWNAAYQKIIDGRRYRADFSTIMPARPRVFCASLADWLDDEVPIEWLARLLKLIHDTPNLDWLLLTKRPQNFEERIEAAFDHSHGEGWQSLWLQGDPPQNVWLGTTVEDQKRADERIPVLLKIPAHIRFLSVEPMLEAVNLEFQIDRRECGLIDDPLAATLLQQACDEGRGSAPRMIHWVIFGGESGKGARPCDISWICDGVRQCQSAGIAPFVKQLGANPYCDNANLFGWPDDVILVENERPGFAACEVRLKHPKGGDINEFPDELQIREFPAPSEAMAVR